MLESDTPIIEALFTALSFVLSVMALTHSNTKDKKEDSVKMIDDFDKSVIRAVNDTTMSGSQTQRTNDAYRAMKLIIKFYIRIESHLINERLTRKYLRPDVKQAIRILLPIADYVFKPSEYPELKLTADRFRIVVRKLKKRRWC